MRKIIYLDAKNVRRETAVFEVNEFVYQFTPGTYKRPVLTNDSGLLDSTLVPQVPASMLQITKIADQTIEAGDCLYAINADRVGLAAFNQDKAHALVVGIASTNAFKNEPVTFSVLGILTLDVFGVFVVNDVLYLDAYGGLTNERPNDGYLVPVAKALGSKAIMVQIGYPSKIGGI